jgi:dihydroorotate dehydrogenase electron transfer subunit
MIQTQVTLEEKESINPAWWRLTLAAPDLADRIRPGQFLFLRCPDPFTCYLRRPIFPARLSDTHLDLLMRPDPDPCLAWLSIQQSRVRLDVIGPLGTGFPLPSQIRNLLLVSDSQVLSPLLGQLRRGVAAGLSVTLALGGSRAAVLYPVNRLPPVVEVQLATLDGSVGHRGPITDLLPELLGWADAVCAVGSPELYRQLKSQAAQVRLAVDTGFLTGLVTCRLFGCGVGACHGCSVTTETGLKLTCLDGPVFDLMDLEV